MGRLLKGRGKAGSTFRRMLLLLMSVLLVQVLIYMLVFFKGGIMEETEDNAVYILTERTANRKLDIENDMVGRWTSTAEGMDKVKAAVAAVLEEHGLDARGLLADHGLCQEVSAACAADLTAMLRRNGVTGAFLVLDCPGGQGGYPGVYIRDYDPSAFSADNRDLMLERGLPGIARALDITMDSYWSGLFRFGQDQQESGQFFFLPMEAARAAEPKQRGGNYFYRWSGRFSLSEADRPVVAYSVPIVWEDGTVLGVLGVDLTVDFLAEQLKYDELGEEKSGAYFLGISRDGGTTYEAVCSAGPNFRAYFGQADSITVEPTGRSGVVKVLGSGGRNVYGAVQPLKLYNSNTPFEDEQWALIGIMSEEHLFRFPNEMRVMIMASMAVALALGMVLILLAARSYTKPLSRLMEDLRGSDPDKPIRLQRIHISEIDALTESIENLSNAAAESASRISKIIAMSHIPIGVFEYRDGTGRVFCSRSLFEVLGWAEEPEEDAYLPAEEFKRRIEAAAHRGNGQEERVYRLPQYSGRDRWVQLFYERSGDSVLGAFLDVTEDMEAKRKMEYERDYDILTDLYNRRAFDERVDRLFYAEEAPLKNAVLLMLDLDNLKYVNDTYGHDYGDRYIQAFARCLEYFYRAQGIVGRRSGDEFNVFLYGFDSQEEARAHVREFQALLGETYVELPGNERIKVRASGGLAWYPGDAGNYTELLRLADFAMYSIKHTVKGVIEEFDRQDYAQRSILIQGQDALNQLIDSRMVRYALQPIASAVDGSLYGYEFLMRPLLEQFSKLENLFLLAKAQSKLLQIEELTWFEAMDTFSRLVHAGKIGPEPRAFINSIGNQKLMPAELRRLEQEYGGLLRRVVVEITETEEANASALAYKKARSEVWGALLALDDFGTGYNSEKILMEVSPDIVKVDISIVRDIDADPDRQALMGNLVGYAKSRGIKVLAEGVETVGELEMLIKLGVDYLQGYYLGKPVFEAREVPPQVVEEIQRFHRMYREKG